VLFVRTNPAYAVPAAAAAPSASTWRDRVEAFRSTAELLFYVLAVAYLVMVVRRRGIAEAVRRVGRSRIG
jgi:uncharacterized membrane protein YeiB